MTVTRADLNFLSLGSVMAGMFTVLAVQVILGPIEIADSFRTIYAVGVGALAATSWIITAYCLYDMKKGLVG